MTAAGSSSPAAGRTAGDGSTPGSEVAESQVSDADRIRGAALECPDVADLSAGVFGEVASYLPGHSVSGVRVDEERVEVHIIARYGRPLQQIADDIGRRVAPFLSDRRLEVAVDDVLLPGDALPDPAQDPAGRIVARPRRKRTGDVIGRVADG